MAFANNPAAQGSIMNNYGEYIKAKLAGKKVSPAQFGLGSALAGTQGYSELTPTQEFLENFHAGGSAVDQVQAGLKNPYGMQNLDEEGIDQGFNQAAVNALEQLKQPLDDISEYDIHPIGDWTPDQFVAPEGAITQADANRQFADSQDNPYLPGSSPSSNAVPPIADRQKLQTSPSSESLSDVGPVSPSSTSNSLAIPGTKNSPQGQLNNPIMGFDKLVGDYYTTEFLEQGLPSTTYRPANLNPSIAINDKILHAIDNVRQHQNIKREVDIFLSANAAAQFNLTFGNITSYYNAQLGKSIIANSNGTTVFT